MKPPSLTTPRTKKGSVALENLEDRGLRLRWSHAGKRYCLALGLPDNKLNRTMPLVKARQIEGDMATGNFDPTLKK
jgi:integrase